jgi:hypothetical protein
MKSSKFINFAMKVATVALVSAAINEVILEVKRRSQEKVVTEVQ